MCKLLLNASYPASGTTSLFYTLWSNKYGHGGGVKESQYLLHIQSPEIYKDRGKLHKSKSKYGKGMPRPWVLPDQLFKTNHSFDHRKPDISKYIDYYLNLWEDVKDEYESVLDFSNAEQQLSESFMLSIKDELLKYFDIKVVMILRDPISRLWSYSNRRSKCEGGTPQSIIKNYYDDPNLSYSEKYKRYVRVWGEERVKVIISEQFYSGDTQPLSDFLDYRITPTYNNIIDLSHMKNEMYSQWCEIDEEALKYASNSMHWVYKEFENTFGYIPDQWIDTQFYK
tara:strand:+ start:969 stop:1817 length:849 start_codon:yes stop_codon:yes gene_type:complete